MRLLHRFERLFGWRLRRRVFRRRAFLPLCRVWRADNNTAMDARRNSAKERIGETGTRESSGMASKQTFRIVTRGADNQLRIREYSSAEPLVQMHTQIGVDDCSTDLTLRGLPVFRGLIGPMPDGKNTIRYESPDVFESLTKEWSMAKPARRRRRAASAADNTPLTEA